MADTRPRYLTEEMKARAAAMTANSLVRDGHFKPDEEAEIAKDIEKCATGFYKGGYALAKSLDSRCGWDCNLSVAEVLDAWGGYARQQIDLAVKEWFERVKPVPPFPIGAKVKTKNSGVGTVDEIYQHGVAQYAVKIDGDSQADGPSKRRMIVNFEDVEAA